MSKEFIFSFLNNIWKAVQHNKRLGRRIVMIKSLVLKKYVKGTRSECMLKGRVKNKHHASLMFTVEQIRRVFDDNYRIIF